MRIGILGGTFNPVHLGHLRAAEEVREKFNLDIIYFIPCNEPPHKSSSELISANHRLEMVRLALKGIPYLKPSDVEIKRGGKSYSIDTIKYFLKKGVKSDKLFFILGDDAFADFKTWKNYREIIELCNFIIIHRPGYKGITLKKIFPLDLFKTLRYNKKKKCYITTSKRKLYLTEINGLSISSTMIRKLIKAKKSVRFLVPDHVVNYLHKTNLYTR